VLVYGFAMALVVFLLKYIQYHFWIRDLTVEVYIGVVAALFTAVGIWLGSRLLQRKVVVEVAAQQEVDEKALRTSGLSGRELEVLRLMASGKSNQEIADQLFISLPTVKSHSSSLFGKLDVKRRTEAVHKAKSLRIIT
jgi:DNA-binding NarL/FixJ family response regulator